MPNVTDPRSSLGNKLLAAIPREEYERLLPFMESVALDYKQFLYEANTPLPYVYFLSGGVVLLLAIMDDGASVDVATIGNEGIVGLPIFLGVEKTAGNAIVQIAGNALRMPSAIFSRKVPPRTPLHNLLQRYTQALMLSMAQTAACNRLRPIEERCSRWLLMTHDCVREDEFTLTQEFLAQMLGVRRATVTVAAGMLQKAGLIRYSRGQITILDRLGLEASSCECYRIIRTEFDRLLPVD